MKLELILILLVISLFVACSKSEEIKSEGPLTENVSVHDPSIIKDKDTYYIIGSHLAFAKSKDLVKWNQLETNVQDGNRIFPNPFESLKEVFEYTSDSDTENRTVWAGDMIKLNGKYYYYFSACEGSKPLSVLGLATSNNVEGPYKKVKIFLKSGGEDTTVEDYVATKDPNVVDPNVFFDKDGQLWMVYGSYSGGIFILKMNPKTGLPEEGQGWGKKLLGGNHSRIEGPYISYNKETGYYYLYLSFGGLDYNGSYNVRVARSKNPDGPYLDSEGNDLINCKGKDGSFFDDRTISKYGVKILGNYTWETKDKLAKSGYVSPGHNSVYFDEELNRHFILFHSRFPNKGEGHEVRVHEMKFNKDGWPVVLPFKYDGKALENVSSINGKFKIIIDTKEIKKEIITPEILNFKEDGTIEGEKIQGTWIVGKNNMITLIINDVSYEGFVEKQWNEYEKRDVISISALDKTGKRVWAYGTE